MKLLVIIFVLVFVYLGNSLVATIFMLVESNQYLSFNIIFGKLLS
jgi:hypothetical protein